MQYADNRIVDRSTGEVLARENHSAGGMSLAAGYHDESREGGSSLSTLQGLLSSALERNAISDARISKAHEIIAGLKAQIATLQQKVSDKRQHFHQQLAIAQGKFSTIAANRGASYPTKKGGQVDISYADLGDMLDEIRPVLAELGISYRQPVLDHPTDHTMTTVQTVLACEGYEEIVSSFSFSTTAKVGGDFKELGSAITYVRRYSLGASLGLAIEGKSKEDNQRRSSGYSSGYSKRNDSRNGTQQQRYNQQSERPAHSTAHNGPQQGAPATHGASPAPVQQPPSNEPGVDDIETQLRTLAFAEVVQLFNSLDNEQKKQYKPIFDERRAQHQNQARRAT